MLANVCLRPKTDEESFRVVDELDNLGIDYALDIARGLIIFRYFSDWGKYINSSQEIKSRIGEMNILWEGGTVTTSNLLYPSPKNQNCIISSKGKCKFKLSEGSIKLDNGKDINWWELKEYVYRRNFHYLESPKVTLFNSIFITLINLGVIREIFPQAGYGGSPFNGFIETFYNLKLLIRMPYRVWLTSRMDLREHGLVVERNNLLEETIDVWLSRLDYEKIKNYPNVRIIINLINPRKYLEWRNPENGNMYIWFKDLPQYIYHSEWIDGLDNFFERWKRSQVYKISEDLMEEWGSFRYQTFLTYALLEGFIKRNPSSITPLLHYSNSYLNTLIEIVPGEINKVEAVVNEFKKIYGAGLGTLLL